MSSEKRFKKTILNQKLTWTIILLLLAIILSFLKPLELAEGGSSTVFAMFVLYLIGYFRTDDFKIPAMGKKNRLDIRKLLEVTLFGVICGAVFGFFAYLMANGTEALVIFNPKATPDMLRLITDTEGNVLSAPFPGTYMTDYVGDLVDNVLGYALIGFGATFAYILSVFDKKTNDPGTSKDEKNRRMRAIMIYGYIFGVVLRLIEATWNVQYYYYAYDHAHNIARISLADNSFHYLIYSLVYSAGYIVAEALLTIALVAIIRPIFVYIRQFMKISVLDYDSELERILLERKI